VRAHRLLLEYDDERSGDFEPLEHVRDDQIVVLGLVTTKTPRVETVDWLSQRIRDAARIVPLERLALGTQCGFSTSVVGNAISEDDERRKLTTIAQTARACGARVQLRRTWLTTKLLSSSHARCPPFGVRTPARALGVGVLGDVPEFPPACCGFGKVRCSSGRTSPASS
jgi:hypothetical protein